MAALLAAAPNAIAQETACSETIWESINAKAYLEANYETVVNESMIFKPDSVFDYSCFDSYVPYVDTIAGPIFSENGSWGVNPSTRLGNALETAIIVPLASYLASNYSHSFLGGRDTSGIVNDGSCSLMYQVWHQAKCRNFLQDESDAFFSFGELESVQEIRLLPLPCEEPPEWTELIDLAYRDPPWRPDFTDRTAETYVVIGWLLEPNVCSTVVSPGHVIVRTFPAGEFDDGICTNPGCIYNGSACVPY